MVPSSPSNPMDKIVPHRMQAALPRPIPRAAYDWLMGTIGRAEPRERLLHSLVAETCLRRGRRGRQAGPRKNEALSIYVEGILLSPWAGRGSGSATRESSSRTSPLPFEFQGLNLPRRYLRGEDLTLGAIFRMGWEGEEDDLRGGALPVEAY
jgi:hypothetical protein